ncbi:MAG: hypothetical protein KJP00_14295 [Bacteroidia bacterium]|nr:hypothetical protein [Bacteroidia bacterium]
MSNSKSLIRLSMGLGVLTVFSLFVSALALTDIYHNNEPSLNHEWNMVRVNFLITILFAGFAMFTLYKFYKNQ